MTLLAIREQILEELYTTPDFQTWMQKWGKNLTATGFKKNHSSLLKFNTGKDIWQPSLNNFMQSFGQNHFVEIEQLCRVFGHFRKQRYLSI